MVAGVYRVGLTWDINLYTRVQQGGIAQLLARVIHVHNGSIFT